MCCLIRKISSEGIFEILFLIRISHHDFYRIPPTLGPKSTKSSKSRFSTISMFSLGFVFMCFFILSTSSSQPRLVNCFYYYTKNSAASIHRRFWVVGNVEPQIVEQLSLQVLSWKRLQPSFARAQGFKGLKVSCLLWRRLCL